MKLAKRMTGVAAVTNMEDRKTDKKGDRKRITNCLGCNAKVVGPVGIFFQKHNKTCPNPKKK